jgi:hypothetical protein
MNAQEDIDLHALHGKERHERHAHDDDENGDRPAQCRAYEPHGSYSLAICVSASGCVAAEGVAAGGAGDVASSGAAAIWTSATLTPSHCARFARLICSACSA